MQLPLYPNPVTNILHIESGLTKLNQEVIYSMVGQKVLEITSSAESIDLRTFSEGVYMVPIHSKTGDTTRKLIKRSRN